MQEIIADFSQIVDGNKNRIVLDPIKIASMSTREFIKNCHPNVFYDDDPSQYIYRLYGSEEQKKSLKIQAIAAQREIEQFSSHLQ